MPCLLCKFVSNLIFIIVLRRYRCDFTSELTEAEKKIKNLFKVVKWEQNLRQSKFRIISTYLLFCKETNFKK